MCPIRPLADRVTPSSKTMTSAGLLPAFVFDDLQAEIRPTFSGHSHY
jgi:hypothetical protein